MSDSIAIGWLGPTHECWGWILEHFRDVSLLSERNVRSWLASQSHIKEEQRRPTALLVAVESRFESTMQIVRQLEQTATPKLTPTVPFCALLGNDWVGHRRTFPLLETLQTFYWYELYDQIIPWLLSLSNETQSPPADVLKNVGAKRRLSPRVQRCIDTSFAMKRRLDAATSNSKVSKLAMVVSETATTRQLWCDSFQAQKLQCIATTPNNLDIWVKPDFIVVDLESEPLAMRDWNRDIGREQLVRNLVRQFPDSLILVADSFPRWSAWETLLECGADLIVGKPYRILGIFDLLENANRDRRSTQSGTPVSDVISRSGRPPQSPGRDDRTSESSHR